jgi:hypothetical protein
MAHLARQHGLVFEGIAKLGVRLLPLDGDAKQSGKTRKESASARSNWPASGLSTSSTDPSPLPVPAYKTERITEFLPFQQESFSTQSTRSGR